MPHSLGTFDRVHPLTGANTSPAGVDANTLCLVKGVLVTRRVPGTAPSSITVEGVGGVAPVFSLVIENTDTRSAQFIPFGDGVEFPRGFRARLAPGSGATIEALVVYQAALVGSVNDIYPSGNPYP